MNRTSISVVCRHLGLGMALMCLVAVLTLLFSFLGTIACAAMAGMMLAANKQLVRGGFASLIFPAVITGLAHFNQISLTSRQSILLPLTCFGTFWATFLMTLAAPYLEGQKASSTATLKESPEQPVGDPSPRLEGPRTCCDELQGRWLRQDELGAGPGGKKLIQIVRDQFSVSMLAVDGQVESVSRGHLKLNQWGPFNVLILTDSDRATAAPTASCELPKTWIYRVTNSTLIIASNFEGNASGRAPMMEIYCKLPLANEG